MLSLNTVTRKLETFLDSYVYNPSVVESTEPEVKIYEGDIVHFWDDMTDKYGFGTFLGFHADLYGETSPYYAESCDGEHRVIVRELSIGMDGKTIEHLNYILLDEIWHWCEVDTNPFITLAE
jgi:hypothetical protein